MLSFQDAVLAALDKQALAVIFSPLCTIIPRLLLRYLQHIALSSSDTQDIYHIDSSVSMSEQIHHDKTHILRAMVALQQNLAMLIETCKFEGIVNKRLQNIIMDEFERVRRYVTLMDMAYIELKQYLYNNFNDYSYAEYNALWNQLKDCPPEITFDKIYSHIAGKQR